MASETATAVEASGNSSERKLSAEWDLEAIKDELEGLESDYKGTKGSDESQFNDVRVIKIQMEQKRKDLEKAKVIKEYKENRADEVIEDGPAYLKEVHDFVNGTVFERYGNLKTKEIEAKKDSTYFELMNYILDGKVIKSRVIVKPGSPDWKKRFDEENLDMHLLSMLPKEQVLKGWTLWLKTNTKDAISEKEGFNIRNFDDTKRIAFTIECAIVEAVDKEGGFLMKDWRMFEDKKEE